MFGMLGQGLMNLFGAGSNSASSSATSGIYNNRYNDFINNIALEEAERNRVFQTNSAERAMQFSAEEAEKNRQWQTEMSNTAFQRAVSDMEKAGLNPILAASQGGASTPAGSAGSGYSASGSQANLSSNDIEGDIKKSVYQLASSAMSLFFLRGV